ncbi:MAG: RraA family protein, partial [Rhodospirillales bacterium]
MMTVITAELLSDLAALDTPTVCNALEEIDNKFRDQGFTTEPLVCPFPNLKPIVGVARTGMIRSVRPNKSIGADKRISYYEYVSIGELPRIAILQDLDGPNA